jgi:hypothetical protein
VTILFFVAALAFGAIYARERRAHHATRKNLTDQMSQFREDRDAAILAVRWVPLKDPDLAKLAKTGCGTCHGAGHYQHVDKSNGLKHKAICQCATRRMMNDAKYAFVGDGIPVRIATKEELAVILPNERQEGTEGEADVIPIAAGNGEVH